MAALRERINAMPDPAVGRNQAIVEARFTDGRALRAHVTDVRGSATRPMTDDELDAKFRAQAAWCCRHRRWSDCFACAAMSRRSRAWSAIAAALHA